MRLLRFYGLLCSVLYIENAGLATDWQPAGPFGGSVQVVATDPHRPGLVLAGARNGLLFRSEDRAKTWQRVAFDHAITGAVEALLIDPSDSAHYLVGIAGEERTAGLWESADSGTHWQQSPSLAGMSIESLVQFSKDPRIRAAGTHHGVYLTRDAGKTWARISPVANSELQDITALAFDAASPNILYAGTPHLPWKTTDGGATWHSVRTGMLDDSDVFSLFVDPAHPSRIFASACSGIYSSETSAGAWKLLDGIPGTQRRTHVIIEDPRRPQVMYAGTTAGMFKSWNGGGRWNRRNALQINSIAFDPSDSRTLYMATEHAGIVVTRDGGETLLPMNQGLLHRNASSVAFAAGVTYVGTTYEGAEGGIFASPDHGKTWRRASFPGGNVRSLAADSKAVYAATADRVYRSNDAGRTWARPSTATLPGEIRTIHLAGDGALWIGTAQGLWRASGKLELKGEQVRAIYGSTTPILAQTNSGVFVSNKSFAPWKPVPLPEGAAVYDAALSCSGKALLATSQGVRRIDENAAEPVRGLSTDTVTAVAFHPKRCDEAYAVQFGALYVSRDAGLNWSAVSAAAPPVSNPGSVDKLWIDPALPNRLFALVRGQGVLFRDLN